MKEKINVKIETTQNNEATTWESVGVLFKEQNDYVVSYPDYTSDTLTDNRLEINKNRMRVIREGAITSDMLFEESMVTAGSYRVMLYEVNVEVDTSNYQFTETDNTLTVYAKYKLLDSGQVLADNEIFITVNRI